MYNFVLQFELFLLLKYMASLTEQFLPKMSKQETTAITVKMQNKMESSDTKFDQENLIKVRKLN